MNPTRRQFLKGSALVAGAVVVPWPALTDNREPFYATLHSSIDGEIARVQLSNVLKYDGRWDAADCCFYAVTGYPFDQIRILTEHGEHMATMPVDWWSPNGCDINVMWEARGLPA